MNMLTILHETFIMLTQLYIKSREILSVLKIDFIVKLRFKSKQKKKAFRKGNAF